MTNQLFLGFRRANPKTRMEQKKEKKHGNLKREKK